MSEIKVNKISPRSGTTLTLGDSGDDFVIPAGATLTNNGTASGFASIAWQSTIVTGTTLSAVAGNGYWIDTTSNACTITLPASASVGDQLIFTDYARTWGTNKITLNTNGLNFQGNQTAGGGDYPEYNTSGQSVTIVYSGATQGWIPTVDDDVTNETPQSYTVDFLVIAGGGGGGRESFLSGTGGGGGAGGYRNSYSTESSGGGGSSETSLSLTPGETYTITVGAGGAIYGTHPTGAQGGDGNNSIISGSGITTITSIGGGGGGGGASSSADGRNGGSGGGAGGNYTVGAGTANQGFSGGNGQTGGSGNAGGGGGGAGAIGGTGASSNGGAGGSGLSSSITGSSVARGGGGGGSNEGAGTPGAGGTGGGGTGANSSAGTPGTSGTVNTGGGGGGLYNSLAAGVGTTGGSGVVILRMTDANYSGTTTGSPTVTTGVGGTDTVLVFNASGSYTA